MKPFLIFLALLGPLASLALAKRSEPEPVKPVVSSTLRFEAPINDGIVARIKAFGRSSGRLVWTA